MLVISLVFFFISIQPSQATGMALAHCILGSFLEVGCHCFPPPLDVPTFASRCLHVQATWETSISERRNYGREMAGQFCLWFRLPRQPRVLWHAAQICDMGDGYTIINFPEFISPSRLFFYLPCFIQGSAVEEKLENNGPTDGHTDRRILYIYIYTSFNISKSSIL